MNRPSPSTSGRRSESARHEREDPIVERVDDVADQLGRDRSEILAWPRTPGCAARRLAGPPEPRCSCWGCRRRRRAPACGTRVRCGRSRVRRTFESRRGRGTRRAAISRTPAGPSTASDGTDALVAGLAVSWTENGPFSRESAETMTSTSEPGVLAGARKLASPLLHRDRHRLADAPERRSRPSRTSVLDRRVGPADRENQAEQRRADPRPARAAASRELRTIQRGHDRRSVHGSPRRAAIVTRRE